jgi:hypothetical protein
MASGKERRAGNHGRPSNGGTNRGQSESLHQFGEQVNEGLGEIGQRFREGYEGAGDALGRGYHQAEEVMAANPMSSLFISFGLGLAFGLIVTAMLGERERESWAERHVPDRLRNLPGSLHDTLDQLTVAVRNLPDTIREHMPAAVTRR